MRKQVRRLLHALDDHRDPLTDADAHRAQGVASTRSPKLVERRGHQPRAAGAKRMTECNRAAIRIDVESVIGESVVARDSKRLCCERFVQFDDVDIAERQLANASTLRIAGAGPNP